MKIVDTSCFFMLIAVKYFEIFSKHNGFGFISKFLTSNQYIFVVSTDKKLLLPL